jgi:hypothetical protein
MEADPSLLRAVYLPLASADTRPNPTGNPRPLDAVSFDESSLARTLMLYAGRVGRSPVFSMSRQAKRAHPDRSTQAQAQTLALAHTCSYTPYMWMNATHVQRLGQRHLNLLPAPLAPVLRTKYLRFSMAAWLYKSDNIPDSQTHSSLHHQHQQSPLPSFTFPFLLLSLLFFASPGGLLYLSLFYYIHRKSLSTFHQTLLFTMRASQSLIAVALAATASAHGVVTSIEGANGVSMPGLSVADGTPRDCSSNGCGSQADTAIIRDREIASGEVGPLGRTQGNGPISAETMIKNFMGSGAAPTNNGAASSVGVEDNLPNNAQNKRSNWVSRQLGALLGGLTGGGAGGANAGNKNTGPPESSVASSAGAGASSGLPTCADDGTVTMTFRQINQDGAGPLTADVDGTSGGTKEEAFQSAEVTQDVPGFGFQGLSLATTTDFPVTVQMPAGMTCDASVGGADNVCVVRVRNGAGAGPFGGSAAFTQTPAARKRALAYRLKKRMELNRSE